MNKYIATVFKSGNSYALRVPKQYALDSDLSEGDKVELDLAKRPHKQQDHKRIQHLIEELQASGGFKSIKDPVAWQRKIRRNRPLPGRE
jgi:antitoxin component of MazEF toxin-antitoxin module